MLILPFEYFIFLIYSLLTIFCQQYKNLLMISPCCFISNNHPLLPENYIALKPHNCMSMLSQSLYTIYHQLKTLNHCLNKISTKHSALVTNKIRVILYISSKTVPYYHLCRYSLFYRLVFSINSMHTQ